MYKLKQMPEDFIVEEVSDIESGEGRYTYWLMEKRNYTTVRAVQHIADALKIPPKYIGFAGSKDKNAVTRQMISIKLPKVQGISLKDISLDFKGKGNEPISLGDLIGNRFTITVRNIHERPKEIGKFINYFGEQRFSRNNKDIGKAIIKKDFSTAIKLVCEGQGDYEIQVRQHLEKHPNDHVGALKRIPKKILSLYIHAYQSWLWNRTAEILKTETIPIVGFDTDLSDQPAITDILHEEGVSQRDFIIPQMPELSSAGEERSLFCEIKDLRIGELEQDELNEGQSKITVTFELPKGCYATEAIKALLNN